MFTGFGLPEILVILVAAVLLFGASRIPEVGENLGLGIKNFKDALTGAADEEEDKKLEESDNKKLEDES